MTPDIYRACGAELEKIALSMATTLSFLRARAAQGARVAPKLMRQAETIAATGATKTPMAMRRLALQAGSDVRAARGAQTLASRVGVAPQRAAFQSRAATDVSGLTVPFRGRMLSRGYSRPGMDYMAGRIPLGRAQRMTGQIRRFLGAGGAGGAPAAVPGAAAGGTAAARPSAVRRVATGGSEVGTAVAKRRTA